MDCGIYLVCVANQYSYYFKRILSESEKTTVVSLCGKTPLAIIMIASTMRTLHHDCLTSEMIEKLQAGYESESTSAILDRCFHTTFSSLHREYQKKLVRLAVFQTAPFDMRSAMNVLAKGPEYKTNNRMIKNDLLYLKCRHLVETEALLEILQSEEPFEGRITDTTESKTKFSLHPLVYEYLKGKSVLDEYSADFKRSEFQFQGHFLEQIQHSAYMYRHDPILADRIIEENRVHFIHFYDTLTQVGGNSCIDSLSSVGSMTEDRFWLTTHLPEIAELILHSEKKIEIFIKMATARKESGNLTESFLWDLEATKEQISAGRIDLARINITRLDKQLLRIKSEAEINIKNYLEANFFGIKGLLLWKGPRSTGNYKEALDFFEQSMLFYQNCSPKERFAVEKAEIVNFIGCVHFKLEDYEKSTEFHQKAYDIILKELKPKDNVHFKLSVYLANIGCVWHVRGNNAGDGKHREGLQKALGVYNQALIIDRKVSIYANVRRSDLLKNRSDVYYGLEEYRAALEDANESLDIRRKHYAGKASPEVISALHQVGHVYYQMGKIADNEGLFNTRMQLVAASCVVRRCSLF